MARRAASEGPAVGVDERHPPIKTRRVTFDWSKTPLHWIPGDPVGTHIINSFNIILPAGEKWFIACVKDALPSITDERLREEVKGFIGQEMVHSRSHQGVIDAILAENGIDVSKLTDKADQGNADREANFAKRSSRAARRRLVFELGAVAAIEHYTAVLGQWVMDNDSLDKAGVDPMMLDLLRWHGAEEVEHRSVVYDVFQHMGGRYPARVASWFVALAFLYSGLIGGTIYIARQDKTLGRKATLPWLIRNYRRSVKQGHIPPIFRLLIGEAPVYLRPGHHPSRICSTQQAIDYLLRSPAAIAAGYDPY